MKLLFTQTTTNPKLSSAANTKPPTTTSTNTSTNTQKKTNAGIVNDSVSTTTGLRTLDTYPVNANTFSNRDYFSSSTMFSRVASGVIGCSACYRNNTNNSP